MTSAPALRTGTATDVRQAVELRRVRLVTSTLERLPESPARREGRDREAIAQTVARGVDLLELLARDASRRLDGHAPALLDDAVQSLVEEVNRITIVREPQLDGGERRGVCIRGPWGTAADAPETAVTLR